MQKWTIGEFVTVVDPDSPCYGQKGRVTGLTQCGAVSVRFAGWNYGMFDSRQLGVSMSDLATPESNIRHDGGRL
jgi:hypothetical protein